MAAVLRHGYFVEPTPITVRKLPYADDDIPPLPPLPEAHMPAVALPPPPKFPMVFILTAFVWAALVVGIVSGLR